MFCASLCRGLDPGWKQTANAKICETQFHPRGMQKNAGRYIYRSLCMKQIGRDSPRFVLAACWGPGVGSIHLLCFSRRGRVCWCGVEGYVDGSVLSVFKPHETLPVLPCGGCLPREGWRATETTGEGVVSWAVLPTKVYNTFTYLVRRFGCKGC